MEGQSIKDLGLPRHQGVPFIVQETILVGLDSSNKIYKGITFLMLNSYHIIPWLNVIIKSWLTF